MVFNFFYFYQSQGHTLGPTQGRDKVKVKVRTWSGHDQVRSKSNYNSKVGPELNTKIGFQYHPLTTHTISKWVFREESAKVVYIIMMDQEFIKDDPGW